MNIIIGIGIGYIIISLILFCFYVFAAIRWDGNHDRYIVYLLGVALDIQGYAAMFRVAVILAFAWPVLLYDAIHSKVAGRRRSKVPSDLKLTPKALPLDNVPDDNLLDDKPFPREDD